MTNRRKQFFYPGQTSWPVIGLSQPEGVGVPNPPFPAPSGYVWDWLADYDGNILTDYDGEPEFGLFMVT